VSDDGRPDGGSSERQAHTVRLELVDEPGELLNALEPVAEKGGNLLSIFHQRGNMTPRGHIPVEVDLECHPERFEEIIAALRDRGVNVMETDAERYGEQVSVLLVGNLIGTDLSDTLSRVEECAGVSVLDISLSAPEGTDEAASARLRFAAVSGGAGAALSAVREIAESKGIRVVEPLAGGEA
jgi:ACT domain-containing protein